MTSKKLDEFRGKLAGNKVMIIGDLMLDHYLMGGVERISPEAPVPVVRVSQEKAYLGGAGNVARNITALGGKAKLIAAVGDDPDGDKLQSLCEEAQIETSLLIDPNRPTTKKTRIIASHQQVVRVDHEHVGALSEEHFEELFIRLQSDIADYPVIIISDYGKGVISREFMARFMAMVKACEHAPLVLVDPKTVNYDCYTGVDLLTPNTKEAGEGAGFNVTDDDSIIDVGQALFNRLQCGNLLITLGDKGMALFEGDTATYHIPTFARDVFDVTGAGDTVIATVALALAAGADYLTACTLANYAAGIVVAQVGAATASIDDLEHAMEEIPEPEVSRWKAVTLMKKS